MSLLGSRTESLPIKRNHRAALHNPARAATPEEHSGDHSLISDLGEHFKTLAVTTASSTDDEQPSSAMSLPKERPYLLSFERKRSNSESSVRHLIPLKSEFRTEDFKHYLSGAKREKYKISCEDGFFRDSKGIYLSGDFTATLLPDDELYAAPVTPHPGEIKIHHSYYNGGLPVKGAFVLYFECGRLINISNESGHYTPTHDEMLPSLAWFANKLKGQSFLFEDHSKQNKANEYNGIEYHLLSPTPAGTSYQKKPISNCQLVPTLFEIKKVAMETYMKVRFVAQTGRDDVISDDSQDDEKGCAYYTDITIDVLLKPVTGPDIFDNPELLKHVCLKNREREIFSYYGCQLKPSHKQ